MRKGLILIGLLMVLSACGAEARPPYEIRQESAAIISQAQEEATAIVRDAQAQATSLAASDDVIDITAVADTADVADATEDNTIEENIDEAQAEATLEAAIEDTLETTLEAPIGDVVPDDAATTGDEPAIVEITATPVQPTEIPTEAPTMTAVPPTATPVPTEVPPTEIPTDVPTEIPTDVPPTEIPTDVPTAVPPTDVPTDVPATEAAPEETPEAVTEVTPDVVTEATQEAAADGPAGLVIIEPDFEPVSAEDDPLGILITLGNPANGEALFNQDFETSSGVWQCSNCHNVDNYEVKIGPSLLGIVDRANTRVEGQGPYTYIYNSILNSSAYIVPGYAEGTQMPHYGDEGNRILSDAQIYDIIAYLQTLQPEEE